MSQEFKERNNLIIIAFAQGKNLSEIGKSFKITRERVRQILKEKGIITKKTIEWQEKRKQSYKKIKLKKTKNKSKKTKIKIKKYKNKLGYLFLSGVKHPNVPKCGIIAEHRLKMARYLKRPLKPFEIVHHINGRKDDNRIRNLMLVTIKNHPRQNQVKCPYCEKIIFFRKDRRWG